MKIVYWNIQDAKKSQAVGELKLIKRKSNPENSEKILKSIGYDKYVYANIVNHQGGIWVLWK